MKKSKSLKWLLGTGLMATAMIATGCSGDEETTGDEDGNGEDAAAEESGDGENILIYNSERNPTSLDPPIGNDESSYAILNNVMEGLTRLAKDEATPEPAMAEDWDVSDDGLTYTFYIREDANWSNGEPVTAEDFEFSFKRLADPETASPAAHHSYWIAGAEAFNEGEGSAEDVQVEAIDEKTLEVTLENPVDFFPSIVAMPQLFPVHKDTVEGDDNWANSADTFVGNGPFVVSEWEDDEYLLITKNEDYWDADTVNLDGVEYVMIEDSNTAYQLYGNDEVHMTGIPSDMAGELVGGPETIQYPRSGIEFQRFNVDMEPFQNRNIRAAFAKAINAQEIVDYITQEGQPVMTGYVFDDFQHPDGSTYREAAGDLHEFDFEEAQELLELGMEEEGYDELPEVNLTYSTSDLNHTVAQAIQEMLQQNLGVEIGLENQEFAVFLDAQRDLELQYSRSSFLGGYNDPMNYLDNFTSGNPMNRTGWSNEEYDQLVSESLAETDPEARFDLMIEAEKVFMDDYVIVPLYYYNTTFIKKDNVQDVVRHPVGFVEFKWASME
ncbi:peptide ABC transporter substrate-binding protein [Alteribacter keqinensis]|uniref:Peptide ABC transporter substrate-binding protein n=1 Tax=Alteribacter keqinensis TaxID=2483800 RepID=A0A3M7TW95_9BACI|nr:peptide ABC transporter substrate-binding protein [Alteribacter keqinensis]RNA69848.1 peptide ABC transporter substrate-binding protein [Alteribacter keqinensis]